MSDSTQPEIPQEKQSIPSVDDVTGEPAAAPDTTDAPAGTATEAAADQPAGAQPLTPEQQQQLWSFYQQHEGIAPNDESGE